MLGYNPCAACGEFVDDGNNHEGLHLCHECLELVFRLAS